MQMDVHARFQPPEDRGGPRRFAETPRPSVFSVDENGFIPQNPLESDMFCEENEDN